MFYVAARASVQEPFLTYENNHNSDKTNVSITPLSGPSIVNVISAIVVDIDTRQAHIRYKPYMSGVELVSHKVGLGRFIPQCRDTNKYTREGNKSKIDAHIQHVF